MQKHERVIAALVGKVKENNGGESANALKTLKKLCTKYELDIDEVLTGKKLERRLYKVSRANQLIVAQIMLRYANTREIYHTRDGKYLATELDEATHLEVTHALDVLIPLFQKELRKVKEATLHAFVHKHDLFWKGERTERIGEEKKKTQKEIEEERERDRIAASLVGNMEDATIYKRLT